EHPYFIPSLSTAIEIGAGFDFTCARLQDESLRCWGANDSGQLGDGSQEERHVPARVRDLFGAREIALGEAHACALLKDGTVKCWGSNTSGQVGDGTDVVSRSAPTLVRGL